jgi:hypothetical protein
MPKKPFAKKEEEFDDTELETEAPAVRAASSTDLREGYKVIEPEPTPQPVKKAASLVAYSDFELLGKEYKAGDAVAVPEGWVHEPGFDTFRSSEFKNKGDRDLGMAFTVPGEITNKKTGERSYSRQVLPVKEG